MSLTPLAASPEAPSEQCSVDEAVATSKEIFIHYKKTVDNHGHAQCRLPVDELCVWGGGYYNSGEHDLSKIVAANSNTLRSVLYCPDDTKGGCLIRPGYHRGDRSLSMVFPTLVEMTIRLDPVLLPAHYGWITPELQRLRLLCVVSTFDTSRRNASPDIRLPNQQSLKEWLHFDARNCNAQILHSHCPKLESITVAVCSTKDEQCTQTDWMELLPPISVPWEVHRLLLLPLLKPVLEKGATGEEVSQSSALSTLSESIINLILSFLGRPSWQCRDHEIPQTVIETLGLPVAFHGLGHKAVLDGTYEDALHLRR